MSKDLLLIDDSNRLISQLQNLLPNDVSIDHQVSGQDGLAALNSGKNYQVVILNCQLPDTDGLSFLRQLSRDKELHYPSFICLAHQENDESLLTYFEAGAEDFVCSSSQIELIVEKVKKLLSYSLKVQELSIEEVKLTELVNTTMMQSSFYGACLDLVSELQFVSDVESIAVYLFDFMQRYGISSAISFNAPNAHFDFDQQSFYCSPLEQQVFELLKDKGRIYEFGNRAVFNSPCVSLLIKNMPEKDTMNYGLFIDIFAKLIPSIEMSFINLLNKSKLKTTQEELKNTISDVKNAVFELQQHRQQLVDKMVLDIGLSFHNYDFTSEQEAFLSNLIESNVIKHTENSEEFYKINQKLERLVASLEQSQKQEIEETPDMSGVLEIELF